MFFLGWTSGVRGFVEWKFFESGLKELYVAVASGRGQQFWKFGSLNIFREILYDCR